jgi:hypothetical protein
VLTFQQFLADAASKGEFVNVLFEERVFELIGTLHKITGPLEQAGIPHELIGGLAVFIHIENASPEHSTLTRDIDLMIHRSDLQQVINIAGEHGFRFRHSAGVDMLLYGATTSAKNAIHLLFSGEKVKASQPEPNPKIEPTKVHIHGEAVCIIPVSDLVHMKLSSFRDKDRVHIRAMDAAGLITPDVEGKLSATLKERLKQTRESE